MLNFWGPKKDKKVINSSTKCLISVKIAIMTPHIIPLPLVNVWLIFDLQKYVNWLCVFSKVNPFFQKAQVFCMDLHPAADPYNVVCTSTWGWYYSLGPIVPTVTQSHTGLHDRPIENSTHELVKLSSLFSAFRKCLKLQNWYMDRTHGCHK